MKSTKICAKCNVEKDTSLFPKNRKSKDRLDRKCKECCNAGSKEYYLKNKDKEEYKTGKAAYRKIWNLANIEKRKANCKAWDLANPEKRKEIVELWKKNNPEKSAAGYAKRSAKRRALKKMATPEWANTEFENFAIQEIYNLARLRSTITGVMHHVDHIVPLNSKIVQGFHCLANLQILEAKPNRLKSNTIWPNMPDNAGEYNVRHEKTN